MSKGTILVTGAAGFTGKHFVTQAIEMGYECVALVQSATEPPLPCKTLIADLLDYERLVESLHVMKLDYVVHLAAIAFVAHGSVEDIYRTNIVGTTNLLDALIKTQQSITKVLIASSGNVYGNSTELPISEQTNITPVNDYAVSKAAMELAVSVRSNQLPIVLTRPFNYTGVGQHPNFLIPKIVSAFKSKQAELQLGNLDVARDFTDVRDLVFAYQKLLEHPDAKGVYNVCSGQAATLEQVIAMCEQNAGYKIEVSVNPEFVRQNEIKVLYGSEQRLRSILGEYRRYTLPQTIQWMFEA